jgi:hypothetical protein
LSSRSSIVVLAALACAMLAIGCAPRIGDGCYSQTNCSINGDRVCDITQPGGYCTVFDCSPDTCPDDSVCVRFEPDTARLSRNVCMRRCSSDGDCRTDKGYRCVGNDVGELRGDGGPADGDAGTLPGAIIGHRFTVADLNRPDGRFCLAPQ